MNANDENLRKAAILLIALDRDEADALLGQLAPAQAALVRQAAGSLEAIDPAEKKAVLREFFETRSGRHAPRDDASRTADDSGSPPTSPFAFLQTSGSQSLLPLLRHEHPQTIAVVAAHLPPDQAARLLAGLPPAVHVEVIRRLANLDEMDPQSLQEVERSVESWLATQDRRHRQRQAGLAAARGILQAAEESSQEMLLASVRTRDSHLASQLQIDTSHGSSSANDPTSGELHPPHDARRNEKAPQCIPAPETAPRSAVGDLPSDFESLAELGDEELSYVLRKAEPELILLALAGASPQLIERVLAGLSTAEADVVRKHIERPGPTKLRDVEAAQRELLVMAQANRAQPPASQLILNA